MLLNIQTVLVTGLSFAVALHVEPASARQLAGKLLFSSGNAEITSANGKRKLVPGTPFYVGDTFATTSGEMKIRLREANNEIVLDRDTRVKLLHASTDESSSGSMFQLYKGTLRLVLGASARKRGSLLQVQTPVDLVTCRERGAFIASTNPAKSESLFVSLQGSLELGPLNGPPTVTLPTGYMARGWQRWPVDGISKVFDDHQARDLVDRMGDADQFNLAWLRRSIERDPTNAAYFDGTANAGSKPAPARGNRERGNPAETSPATTDQNDKKIEDFIIDKLGI